MNHPQDGAIAPHLIARWIIAAATACAAGIPTSDTFGDDNTRRGLVRPSGGGSGSGNGSGSGGSTSAQPPPPARRDPPPPQSAPQGSSPPSASEPSSSRPAARPPAASPPGAAPPPNEDRTRRLLMRPGALDRSAFAGIPMPSGLDTARAADRDNTVRSLVRGSSADRGGGRWDGDGTWRVDGDRSLSRRRQHGPADWHAAPSPRYLYSTSRDAVNFSPAPVFRYVPPQVGPVFNDLRSWSQWSWGVWDGRSASWGTSAYWADDGHAPRRSASWWKNGHDAFPRWRPWDAPCWKVYEIVSTDFYEPLPQFVRPDVQGGGTIILGFVPEDDQGAGDAVGSAMVQSDEAALPVGVNAAFDVVPLFMQAVNGANRGDYSAAIYAMRRAALVNPSGLVAPGSRVASILARDEELAEEARRARGVFENPPARVVSEADAAFMVAALCAVLGEPGCARQSISLAQQVGDRHTSTALFRRALDGVEFGSSGPWIPGRKLR